MIRRTSALFCIRQGIMLILLWGTSYLLWTWANVGRRTLVFEPKNGVDQTAMSDAPVVGSIADFFSTPVLFGASLHRDYSMPVNTGFCKSQHALNCGQHRVITDRLRLYNEFRALKRANNERFECHEQIKVALHGSEFKAWWPVMTETSIANLHLCPANCTAVNYVPTPTHPNDTSVDVMFVTNDGVGYLRHLTQPYQKLAVLTSEVHYGLNPASLNVTDIFVHTRREADVWINYFGYETVSKNADECIDHPSGCLDVSPANISHLWWQSNQTYSGLFVSDCSHAEAGLRDWYIGSLQSIMKLDSFGRCHQNAIVPDWAKNITPFYHQKVQVLSKYPFVFAFENQWVDDYVSEKFFQMFRMPGIGVYLGAPNAEETS
eukprot:TRINITY_DN9748_c0_g1_i1.p1 TRINITY_DN9748_c0_g1~~TRINITY_DN9748_c0_g1_i1.p1  ORF type:complete len:377 (-),score=-28.04 TRINITY_DN9748_c0_g1_i1:119-1249(-)